MKNYGPVMAAITEFVGLLLVSTFSGQWIDTKTQHNGRFIFVGVAAGFGVGIFRLVRRLKALMEEDDD